MLLLWLLALCLPLQGYAVATERVVGAGHVHVGALALLQVELAHGWQALSAPLAPWPATLTAPARPMLVHASSQAHDEDHERQHARGVAHRHAADEPGVIALAEGATGDAQATGGAFKRVLADIDSPVPGSRPSVRPGATARPPTTASPAFVSIGSEPLERPPR